MRNMNFKKLAVVFTLLFLCFQLTLCFLKGKVDYELTNKEVERIIKEDSVFRDIDNFCSQIPLPDDFKLLGKVGLVNTKGISYKYASKHNFEYVENFFKDYFLWQGWNFSETKSLPEGLEFTNQEYRIRVFYLGDDSDYVIDCYKKLDINEIK